MNTIKRRIAAAKERAARKAAMVKQPKPKVENMVGMGRFDRETGRDY